ncbi:hypothetical protein [Micrococcus luteus]|uniref:hypothetical protein n=1 Tax=Micrococcus luteus TaxID=1270 RepID=UPI002303777F|nr:hypothetical protein [Micrococcus luteus]
MTTTAALTEILTLSPAPTHKATGAGIQGVVADVITREDAPQHVMVVLDTAEDGTRYGIHLSPYSASTYSGFPAFMAPNRDRPDNLGSIYDPLGCILARDADPAAADNAGALALLCRRLKRLRARL